MDPTQTSSKIGSKLIQISPCIIPSGGHSRLNPLLVCISFISRLVPLYLCAGHSFWMKQRGLGGDKECSSVFF